MWESPETSQLVVNNTVCGKEGGKRVRNQIFRHSKFSPYLRAGGHFDRGHPEVVSSAVLLVLELAFLASSSSWFECLHCSTGFAFRHVVLVAGLPLWKVETGK